MALCGGRRKPLLRPPQRRGGSAGFILVDVGARTGERRPGVPGRPGGRCTHGGIGKENEEIWLPHATAPLALPKDPDPQGPRSRAGRNAPVRDRLNQRLRGKTLSLTSLEAAENRPGSRGPYPESLRLPEAVAEATSPTSPRGEDSGNRAIRAKEVSHGTPFPARKTGENL
jgi:hypothetical protein